MAQGPPPSEAGTSRSSNASIHPPGPSQTSSTVVPAVFTSTFQLQPPPTEQPQTPPIQYQHTASYGQPYTLQTPHTQTQTVASTNSSVPGYGYYGYHQNWNNSWQAYQYNQGTTGTYQYPYTSSVQQPKPVTPITRATPSVPQKRKVPSPSPSPPPPPPFHDEWDRVVKEFLAAAGLGQALRGFEMDMVVMSPEWERSGVPKALKTLSDELIKLSQLKGDTDAAASEGRELDERKLSYVHFAPNIEPQTPTSVTKDISQFLARHRARNDASNRNEFLLTLAEKRKKLEEDAKARQVAVDIDEHIPSCARTDAKTQNRDLQMKYDIAKNEDGPLRKTMKTGVPAEAAVMSSQQPAKGTTRNQAHSSDEVPTADRYPAFDERLQNVETHLAVRYVPSPPRSLLDRVKFIEDHIIHLEKQFPPWAALHFNQPSRGWPPPPRLTPIIVPSHLTSTSTTSSHPPQHPTADTQAVAGSDGDDPKTKTKPKARNKSSLHRAVMERLEVQKAMNDLAGVKTEENSSGKENA
ncbi:hypothetical protein BXZ70DRAFT_913118 [Cristinia sonorae]|uniref:Uncharacterized protein n=1 Tax=Cristinia sonorae TaxID=1940300 RepID=A0A8K0V1M2_9AGAR|nr:hypothetical protein BXZ70DRAFT_913118 [Cristinia sonorae]